MNPHPHEIAAFAAFGIIVAAAAVVLLRNHRASSAALLTISETTQRLHDSMTPTGAPLAVKVRERVEMAPGVTAYNGMTAFGYMIQFLTLEGGAVLPPHIHAGVAQSFILLKGRVVFKAAMIRSDVGIEKTLENGGPDHPEGVLAYALPGQRHEIRALEPSELLVVSKPPLVTRPAIRHRTPRRPL